MNFNTLDTYYIQDCLESYKVLLNWVPVIDKTEELLKAERLNTVNYLIDKAEKVLKGLRDE